MSNGIESLSIGNVNLNPSSSSIPYLWSSSCSSSRTPSMTLRFHSFLCSCSYPRRFSLVPSAVSSRRFAFGLLPLHRPKSKNSSIFASSASHEESKPSEIQVENKKSDIKAGSGNSEKTLEEALAPAKEDLLKLLKQVSEESEEVIKKLLAFFEKLLETIKAEEPEEAWVKEQALKMQSISQEAYDFYSKKAIVVLKEKSEQLKIQTEKAREDLTILAQEISAEGKEYLSTAAENSPEPVKEIVETFSSSTDDLNEVSKVRDFYIGIPYGFLLSFGGFLNFMLTGSISAIRFGVILGGTLLALSVSSLRSWKRAESSSLALKGQAAIASILFLRDLRTLIVRSSVTSLLTTLISGGIVAFYIYRITMNSKHTNGSSLEPGTEN